MLSLTVLTSQVLPAHQGGQGCSERQECVASLFDFVRQQRRARAVNIMLS